MCRSCREPAPAEQKQRPVRNPDVKMKIAGSGSGEFSSQYIYIYIYIYVCIYIYMYIYIYYTYIYIYILHIYIYYARGLVGFDSSDRYRNQCPRFVDLGDLPQLALDTRRTAIFLQVGIRYCQFFDQKGQQVAR